MAAHVQISNLIMTILQMESKISEHARFAIMEIQYILRTFRRRNRSAGVHVCECCVLF